MSTRCPVANAAGNPAVLCCVAPTDEDFEKWCVSLFEALDAAPELLGAAASGGGDQSLATYRATVLEGGRRMQLCICCYRS
jgi:hypothetical protein